MCLGEPKGNDSKNPTLNHVKYVGVTHLVIHVVNFVEEVFKGVLFFEEVLQRLPDDVARENILMDEEEKRKITEE